MPLDLFIKRSVGSPVFLLLAAARSGSRRTETAHRVASDVSPGAISRSPVVDGARPNATSCRRSRGLGPVTNDRPRSLIAGVGATRRLRPGSAAGGGGGGEGDDRFRVVDFFQRPFTQARGERSMMFLVGFGAVRDVLFKLSYTIPGV